MITALNITVTTTCDQVYQLSIMTRDLCKPVAQSEMMMLPDDCQPANFSITAQSDAGISQPSSPVTVSGKSVNLNCCSLIMI